LVHLGCSVCVCVCVCVCMTGAGWWLGWSTWGGAYREQDRCAARQAGVHVCASVDEDIHPLSNVIPLKHDQKQPRGVSLSRYAVQSSYVGSLSLPLSLSLCLYHYPHPYQVTSQFQFRCRARAPTQVLYTISGVTQKSCKIHHHEGSSRRAWGTYHT
jgi:hypothetical protein